MRDAAGPPSAKRVLIATASNWPSTAALPRLFARGGYDVTVLCHPNAVVARSRYVRRIVPVAGALRETVATLRDHLATDSYAWIVAGDDPFVAALLREPDRDALATWFPFSPNDADAVAFATSKHAFLEIARRTGIPVADFTLCSTLEAFLASAGTFGYPFVAKDETGHAGGAIHRVTNEAGARALWEKKAGTTLAAQRFVVGRVGTIEVLWDRGVPRCFMGAYKVDCHPSDFGAASAKQPFRHPAFEGIARSIGTVMGYHGIGAIDFIREERTGDIFVLELNPRPSGGGFALDASIAARFHREFDAFVRRDPSRGVLDFGTPARARTLFPNAWYYFVELADKRNPRTWLRALEAFARAPFDDAPLVAAYLRVFAGYYAERSPVGKRLKTLFRSAFRLTSRAHPGAR